MNPPLKIAFFGSGRFAVTPLEALLNQPEDFALTAIIYQPDRPVGRQGKLESCPVGQATKAWLSGHPEADIRIFQPQKIKGDANFAAELKNLKLDLAVVASYGQIITADVLAIPRLGFLNLHGSLLPKWRGASPIQAAILAGDGTTGVSLMVMDDKIDHGPVLKTAGLEITPNDTYASLEVRLARLAADLAVAGIKEFASGAIKPLEQVHDQATFCQTLRREHGLVDWKNEDAARVERKLRAYYPWPGIFTVWNDGDKRLRIKLLKIRVDLAAKPQNLVPGTVIETEDGLPAAIAADGRPVAFVECQLEGKKVGSGKSTLCGHRNLLGAVLDGNQPGADVTGG